MSEMDKKFIVGQRVNLLSSAGPIVRIVVIDLGEVLLVTREEEFSMAQMEGREPASIGFKKQDVIEDT